MRHQFVRSLAGSRDPNFKNVTLLLHGDGTNGAQNNTFLDSSGSNNAITRTGNVAQGSFSPYGDRWSNYFDGTGDYLSRAFTSTTDGMYPQGTTYTIEAWIFPTTSTGLRMIYDCSATNTNNFGEATLFINGTTVGYGFRPTTGGTYVSISGGTALINNWNHIAVSVQSGSARFFLNGTQVGSTITISAASFTPVGAAIGRLANGYITGVVDYTGYISNVRLVQSTALYTSNFTPSTAPLTAITNTSLLTCQSNRFRDASTNNFTITRNGDVSVQRFSPFSPDAQYRTDRIAGSAYFDGNDYLQIANRALKFSSGFFTAECWVYISAYPASLAALFNDHYWQGGHNGGYIVYIVNTGQVRIEASNGNFNNWGGTVITSSNSLIRGQWNHLAIVRGANNLVNIYINGISTTTPVARTSFELNSGVAQSSWHSKIGLQVNDTNLWYGFTGIVSDLRVINGKCLYTANFTPPTEPLTAIPETTFLGRFANASIVDNAMMNNLETVGNAQIDTTTKKYGTGSLYFDGTGDYLTAPNNAAFQFGTGNVTIESWIYISGNSAANPEGYRFASICSGIGATGISNDFWWVVKGNTTTTGTGVQLRVWNSGVGANVIDLNFTISQNTWHHIAFVRSGNTAEVFFNGTSQGTSSFSGTITAGTNPLLIGYSQTGTSGNYNHALNGYIDDLRITKGVARYTANFTPPTAPFPDF